MFTPHLARARRQGLGDFGRLANRYVTEFDEKWMHGARLPDEPLLGSADIQSLADLGNSFSTVREMRLVPFGWQDVTRLAAVSTAAADDILARRFRDLCDQSDLLRTVHRDEACYELPPCPFMPETGNPTRGSCACDFQIAAERLQRAN